MKNDYIVNKPWELEQTATVMRRGYRRIIKPVLLIFFVVLVIAGGAFLVYQKKHYSDFLKPKQQKTIKQIKIPLSIPDNTSRL